MLLDPRTTISLRTGCGLDAQEVAKCKTSLGNAYFDFAFNSSLYHKRRQQAEDSRSARESATKVASKRCEDAVTLRLDDFSSDEDEDVSTTGASGGASAGTTRSAAVIQKEYEDALKSDRKFCKTIRWHEFLPEVWESVKAKGVEVDFPYELATVDMVPLLRAIFKYHQANGNCFGFLPKMSIASEGSIGGVRASSFCERINSAANLVCTDGNSLLAPVEIDKLVTLRMNRKYIELQEAQSRGVSFEEHKKELEGLRQSLFDGNDNE